ncbi:MAG TPA: ArnT family glycosyltransferase [Xenococcaceae cyanobacterium]
MLEQRRDFLWLWGFGIAAFVLYTFNLGNVPLRDWDEAIVAGVSREIYRHAADDTWLYPQNIGGVPYWNKPPLIHWLIAICYAIFGVNEWSSRFPGAILAALSVPLLYLIGRLIFPLRISATLATLVYLTLIQMVRHGRLAMLDGAIACWFCLTMLGLLITRFEVRGLWLVGIGLSAACLTKGIAIGVLLGAIALTFWWLEAKVEQRNFLSLTKLLLTISLSFLPVIVWYSLQYWRYGPEFLGINLGEQTFSRLWNTLENNQGQPWYYLGILAKDTLPWLWFLPGGIKLALQQRDRLWAKLVLVWGGVYFLAISLMATKLPWYIIPVYPAIALIIGANLAKIWHHYFIVRNYRAIIFFSLLTVVGAVASIIYSGSPQPEERDLLLVFLTLTLGLGTTSLLLYRRSRYFIVTIGISLYLGLLFLFNTSHWNWELAEQYPVKPVAKMIQAVTPPKKIIYTSYGDHRPALNFYSDRLIIPLSDAQLQKVWLESSSVYFLLSPDALTRVNLLDMKLVSTTESWTIVTKKTQY